jgi:diguanylate cyclase (GGDEF)-like protein
MDKLETDAKLALNQLRELSAILAEPGYSADPARCFEKPLEIMRKAMSFDVSVLYEITNAVDDALMLKTVKLADPKGFRPDLFEGRMLELSLSHPDPRFVNEVRAFQERTVSSINVPGQGCDIMGFIYLPQAFGGGYLFGGDFTGKEAGVKDYEASVCEIMCNYLSTILIKGQLEELAINDNLTGLFNARKIREELDRVCGRYTRKTKTHAVIALCDIDHFKKVNDTFGHLQGDRVLKEVGHLLKSSLRSHFDIAGRYGGEEFLIIFDETDMDTAFDVVERIREKIAGTHFTRIDESGKPDPDKHLAITVSLGLAEHRPDEDKDRDRWISEADQALYRAKETGRNRTVCHRS